jgi:urea transport system permease protein
VIRFLYGRPLETLLATWGISLMLQQLVRSIFGAQNVGVENPSWMSGGVQVLGNLQLPGTASSSSSSRSRCCWAWPG